MCIVTHRYSFGDVVANPGPDLRGGKMVKDGQERYGRKEGDHMQVQHNITGFMCGSNRSSATRKVVLTGAAALLVILPTSTLRGGGPDEARHVIG